MSLLSFYYFSVLFGFFQSQTILLTVCPTFSLNFLDTKDTHKSRSVCYEHPADTRPTKKLFLFVRQCVFSTRKKLCFQY